MPRLKKYVWQKVFNLVRGLSPYSHRTVYEQEIDREQGVIALE